MAGKLQGAGGIMKTIQRVRIDGHEAKLVLANDNNTLQVLMDDDIIESYEEHIWDNIKNEVWARKGLLTIVAGRRIKRQKLLAEMERIAEEAFR